MAPRLLSLTAVLDEQWTWRPGPSGPDADDRIRQALGERLAAATDVDARHIRLAVRDREVILEGTTRDERMTRAVMLCVLQVPGVRAVRNYLETRPTDAGPHRGGRGAPRRDAPSAPPSRKVLPSPR